MTIIGTRRRMFIKPCLMVLAVFARPNIVLQAIRYLPIRGAKLEGPLFCRLSVLLISVADYPWRCALASPTCAALLPCLSSATLIHRHTHVSRRASLMARREVPAATSRSSDENHWPLQCTASGAPWNHSFPLPGPTVTYAHRESDRDQGDEIGRDR